MISFISIALVVVKLKTFKVLRTSSIHEMNLFGRFLGSYFPKYDPNLPKLSPEFVLLQTKALHFLKDLSFYGKEADLKFALLVQL